jgi:hypothetical protein
MGHRHPEEAAVRLFPGLGHERRVPIGGNLIEMERLGTIRHETDEALTELELQASHYVGVKAIGRHQHVPALFVLGQVEGARIHLQGLAGTLHDDLSAWARSVPNSPPDDVARLGPIATLRLSPAAA